jgi:hypothetical protein
MAQVILNRSKAELGDLPLFCARCGEPTAVLTLVKLPYTSKPPLFSQSAVVADGLPGCLLLVVALLSNLWTTRRIALQLPLCDRHQRSARWHDVGVRRICLLLGITGVALAVCCLVVFAILPRQIGSLHWVLASCAVVCIFSALLIYADTHNGFIYPARVTDEEVDLRGVAVRFSEEVARRNANSAGYR